MDPLIVEDGTGVADANTWVSRADFIGYAANLGFVIPDEDASDVNIFKAMNYLIGLRYKGDPIQPLWEKYFAAGVVTEEWPNELPFPRVDLFPGDTLYSLVRTIPSRLKRAECQLALDIFNGFDPSPNIASNAGELYIASEKIGPLSTQYQYGDRNIPLMPLVQSFLRPLLVGNGLFSVVVKKA